MNTYETSSYDNMVCNVQIYNGSERVSFEESVALKDTLELAYKYRKEAILKKAKDKSGGNILYQIIEHDEMLDIITTVTYFVNTYLTDEEVFLLPKQTPFAEFGIIYAGQDLSCKKIAEEEKSKKIRPITLKEANEFVRKHHRHHDTVTGCKFAIGLKKTVNSKEKLIGVAICGRPVSRYLDDGLTLEINRLCMEKHEEGCSMLYGAATRTAKSMGYEKVITYILASEKGISLKASGFTLEDECCGGTEWNGSRTESRPVKKKKVPPKEMKQRWAKKLA